MELLNKNIVAKKTKKGKIFYGCSEFPKCDYALWDDRDKTQMLLENLHERIMNVLDISENK